MIILLTSLALAEEPQLWDASPHSESQPVLVVSTPGVKRTSYLPLLDALSAQGRDAHLLEWDCSSQSAADYAEAIDAARAQLPEGTPVLAHGLGATLVLQAHDAGAGPYVLLGPVLQLRPVAATTWLAEQTVGASVLLSDPLMWEGRDLAQLLVGPGVELGCVSATLASEVQGWITAGVPLTLRDVDTDVFIAVSGADRIAPVEMVVPRSRELPNRELVRLGLGRLDPQDFTHGELLTHDIAVRVAVRALEGL